MARDSDLKLGGEYGNAGIYLANAAVVFGAASVAASNPLFVSIHSFQPSSTLILLSWWLLVSVHSLDMLSLQDTYAVQLLVKIWMVLPALANCLPAVIALCAAVLLWPAVLLRAR